MSYVVGEVLAKKFKLREERGREKRRSHSGERRRSKHKRTEKDEKEKSKKKRVMPTSWIQFKKEGHKVYHFRRFKYLVEKDLHHDLRDKKRHKHSHSR